MESLQGRCVKRANCCRDSAGLYHVAVPWLLWYSFAFGIAMPIMMQHRFIRGGDWNAGRALRGALAGEQARPWPAKTPPGSCSVALSDRSQCDSTGPAAVWADDQAVTRALQARKSPRQICAKRFWPEPANGDEPQDAAASGQNMPKHPSQYERVRCQFLPQMYSLTQHSTRRGPPC